MHPTLKKTGQSAPSEKVRVHPSLAREQVRVHPSLAGEQVRVHPSLAGEQVRVHPSPGGEQVRVHPSRVENRSECTPALKPCTQPRKCALSRKQCSFQH